MTDQQSSSDVASNGSLLHSTDSCHSNAPIGLKWRSNTLFICLTVGIGAFTDMFLYGLIVPVLPFMLQDRVKLPESEIQTTISNLLAIYAAASCVASPLAGVMADRFASSRQFPFLIGLILLLASTVLLALGSSIPVLALARALQGASGGFVWTIGLALLIETVGQENLGKALGTVFSFCSVAGLFAPLVGGILYAKSGYFGVFGLGIAFIAIDFFMRIFMIEKKQAEKYITPCDSYTGSSDVIADENTPLLASSSTPDCNSKYRLPEPASRITKEFPILLLLHYPALVTAFFIGLIQALLLGAYDATVPLVASSFYGFDSLKVGLLFLPLGGSDFFLGPVFGWCVDRWGTRIIAVIGFTFLIPALALLRLTEVVTEIDLGRQIAMYASLLALNGIGLAMIGPVSMVESGNIIDKYYKANTELFGGRAPYAQLYGISSMMWCLGLTVGPLMAGALKEKIGYGNMNAVLAGICGFTAILSGIFLRGRGKAKRAAIEDDY
ncbi:MFS general substrate transporter [Aaosphaeria arxii CBS 175.79]|uniref:MFS general substrate transporter n=1 Tax=Aaosphaeria arxii CBS 175.79 TaxID=1450172 RepID=A0A6A5Y4I7_9PLEO|nr:MFS general substrate transporter [Aaosphaeria arxii CBS 175.79]KAF2019947.1 MFS general substrate transporter [Aaosphaeria arxii CBS 175.79]